MNYAALTDLLDFGEGGFVALVLVLMRVGAIAALLPGFGEQNIPMRIRLLVTLAFTAIVWPSVAATLPGGQTLAQMPGLMVTEAAIGLLIGISIRLLVLALQLAGSIAAQSVSISQIAGAGATPDPMPAMGNLLVMTGLALVMALGLPEKVALAMIDSYRIFPAGLMPSGGDVASWGVAHVAASFALALTMAAPFLVASFAYNVGLGAINRAMPSLMVAFIGAPLITGVAILLLGLAAPTILLVWSGRMDMVLGNPMGAP